MEGLYVDPETGKRIITHSMMKAFRRCPKMAEYKYVERLKPRVLGRPLRLGTWMHKLIEAKHRGQDWREMHHELTLQWGELFDEERDAIGNLPHDCERLMRSYLWHYEGEEWKILDTEFVLECELPDGSLYRCKLDNLIENQFGLWIVDHKWHRRLPDLTFRMLDSQSALYIWCALRNKIPVQGHIWNYGLSKPPAYPEPLRSSPTIPQRWDRCDTDYPTMVRWFKEHAGGVVPQRCRPKMRYLKSLRYRPGEMQSSSFFRRDILEKTPQLLKRMAQEGYHTARRMETYPWDRPEIVERVVDRSCMFMCSYTDLCSLELFTGSTQVQLRRSRYKVGDPQDYYNDDRQERE